ncbi:MAG: hypothetical protein CL912_14550 [Deltaproteobacteria bacterium]|nr:hypothetical protein [Deltaproteobacteria bacterium]
MLKNDTRCLKQLSRYLNLKAAFDNLLNLPRLWKNIRINTLNKLISMGYKEVNLSLTSIPDLLRKQNAIYYLKGIKDI